MKFSVQTKLTIYLSIANCDGWITSSCILNCSYIILPEHLSVLQCLPSDQIINNQVLNKIKMQLECRGVYKYDESMINV